MLILRLNDYKELEQNPFSKIREMKKDGIDMKLIEHEAKKRGFGEKDIFFIKKIN